MSKLFCVFSFFLMAFVSFSFVSAAENPPAILQDANSTLLWLDASQRETMTIDDDGNVSVWNSRVGSHSAGKQTASGFTYPTFNAFDFGVPVVDFGELGVKKDLLLSSRLITIRTVIFVGKIVNDGGAFWLGDSNNLYDFHRGSNGAYANAKWAPKFDKIWNGVEQVANIHEEIPDPDKINVITIQMKQNCVAHSLTKDRNLDGGDKGDDGRYGGRQIAELICFNRVLTDEERSAIVSYLEKKWIEKEVLNVTVSASSDDSDLEFSNDGGENWANTAEVPSVMGNDVVVEVRRQNGENSFFLWEGLPADAVFMNDMHSKVSFKVDRNRVLKASAVASGQENVWLGGDGEFEDSNKWSLGRVPCLVDNVIIDNSVENVTNIITVLQPFSIGSLTIGGSGGGVRLVLKNGLSTNFVAGAVVVEAKGRITHHGPTSDNSYRLNLKAGGNMEVKIGGSVGSHGMGFARGTGITSTGAYGSGVSKGCHGGYGTSASAAYSYGNIRLPSYPGMGGTGRTSVPSTWGCGGGVVNIEVLGDLTVNGEIESDAGGEYDQSQAGGSVILKCNTLLGSGRISACPTRATAGGGRIAIYQSGAGELSFSGVIGSSGGSEFERNYKYYYEKPWTYNPSTQFYDGAYGAGTIYVENKNDLPGRGKLIIKGGKSNNALLSGYTDISALVEDSQEPFGEIIITNGARVKIRSGCTLKVSRKLDVRGGQLIQEDETAMLEIVGSEDFEYFGSNMLYNVKCAVPGKKLYFGAPSELSKLCIADGGSIVLNGGSKETPISLLSTDPTSKWWIYIGNASQDISYVAIANCDASAGSGILAIESVDLGGNTKCSFSSKIVPGEMITWTGAKSSDWKDGENWSLNRVVVDTDVVVVPAGVENQPLVERLNLVINELKVEEGSSITFSNCESIALTNNFVCAGNVNFIGESKLLISNNADFSGATFSSSGQERIYVSGDGNQEINFGGLQFNKLKIKRDAGMLFIKGGFDVREFWCDAKAGAQTIRVEAGTTIAAGELYINALADSTALLTMESSIAGGKWYLKAGSRGQLFTGVKVSDCDARAGAIVVAGVNSVDVNRSNDNFDFDSQTVVWDSPTGGSFEDEANWEPQVLPTENTMVAIIADDDEDFIVTADSPFSVASLMLRGSLNNAKATLEAKAAYNIANDLGIGANAIFVSNAYNNDGASPNMVGGDVRILNGGILTHSGPQSQESAKLHIAVKGDFSIESGASINVEGKGYMAYSGKGYARDGNSPASSCYGGFGNTLQTYSKPCYGSVYFPFDLGTGTVEHDVKGSKTRGNGGGAVKIIVDGIMSVEGKINANGSLEYDSPPTGGSIFLDVGVLEGSGTISAAAGAFLASQRRNGGGGRIAIYQRDLPLLSEFTGLITTCNGKGGGAGTICYSGSNSKDVGVDVHYSLDVKQSHESQFPMKDDYYKVGGNLSVERQLLKAYANANLTIKNASVVVTNAAAESLWSPGATICIRDLDMANSNAKLFLNGCVLQVLNSKHKNGRGWAVGSYEEAVANGNIVLGEANGEPGKVVWNPIGFSIKVR